MTTRRGFIGTSAVGLVGALGWKASGPLGAVIPRSGVRVREFTLRARAADWDVGAGRAVRALTYDGSVPGPVLRVKEGDLVRVTLVNELQEPTTIHWHGIPLPFAMDGVPELTQPPVAPGGRFVYEFAADVPGTYWYHSHFGYQFELGLFGALVVEPRAESLAYDREYTLVLDDWMSDPANPSPAADAYNYRVAGTRMGEPMDTVAMSQMHARMMTPAAADSAMAAMRASMERTAAKMRAIDSAAKAMPTHASHGARMPEPLFDAFTINGQRGDALEALTVRRGDRVRLRLVNAGTATVFPVYVAGHRMTVTHLDGQPIQPSDTDVVVVGMGERVDVLVHATNPGVWRIGSADPAHRAKGLGIALRYRGAQGNVPLDGSVPVVRPEPYREFTGADAAPSSGRVSREHALSFKIASRSVWTINDKVYPHTDPIEVQRGERVRVKVRNDSAYAHPVHLHGHFFDVVRPYAAKADVARPIRKDTLTLYHMDEHVIEFTADNPGAAWFLHCHNQYHHVGGMATIVRYV